MTSAASGGNDLAAKADPYIRRLAAKADPYIRRIEEIDGELDSEKSAYMATCRTLRRERKDIFGDAKDAGIAVKPLKAVLKRRRLERSIEALPSDFDFDESAQYSALAAAFAGTPFGDFAAERAAGNGDGGEEVPRPDEEYLSNIGRGPTAQLSR
jgi:uncharacterized protein (UPF0335 family)